MRALRLLRPAAMLGSGLLLVSGCAQRNSDLPLSVDGALPDSSGAAATAVTSIKPAPPPVGAPAPVASAPTLPVATGAAPDSSFDNLELVDASLKGKLAILRVGAQPGATNLLAVFAGLKNKTSHPLNLEVQTIYRDKAEIDLNTGSWIRLTLAPHEETEYHSASISDQATDFLIRIRRAPRTKPAAPTSTQAATP